MKNGLWLKELVLHVEQVTEDVQEIAATGKYPVVTLLRGYSLLERLGNWEEMIFNVAKMGEAGDEGATAQEFYTALEGYRQMYLAHGEQLYAVMDPEQMKMKVAAYMGPWKRRYNEALEDLQKATELWEAAKSAHKARMEGSFLEKWKTLRKVRKMAGFRLEKGRTGNFVTRTFDLMQQAQAREREAQLQVYEHNVEYRCTPDTYLKIFETISEKYMADKQK